MAQALYLLQTGGFGDGEPAKRLARGGVGEVHLHGRQAGGLYGVADGVTVMSVGGGVDDQPIGPGHIGGYKVDDAALAIGLEYADFRFFSGGVFLYSCVELLKRKTAIDRWFPLSQKIEVGTMYDKYIHLLFN